MRAPPRILLAGGGSGGSAAPVIAVAEAIRRRSPDTELLYIGTRSGPEVQLAKLAGLSYLGVPGRRLRRYASWRNLTDPTLVAAGLARAWWVVRRFRPSVGFGAGGFATVPVLLAARLSGARVAIHQQDVQWGLANRMLLPFAAQVTVAFPQTAASARRGAPLVMGNPVRDAIIHADPAEARTALGLDPARPVLLAMGGGTGSASLNELVVTAAPSLLKHCQIVHIAGGGKSLPGQQPGYHQFEFLTDLMAPVLQAADLVVSRAGMSSLGELAALRKPCILIPMPDSHQEANAGVVGRLGAARVLHQGTLTAEKLVSEVVSLLNDGNRCADLGAAMAEALPTDAAERIAGELLQSTKPYL